MNVRGDEVRGERAEVEIEKKEKNREDTKVLWQLGHLVVDEEKRLDLWGMSDPNWEGKALRGDWNLEALLKPGVYGSRKRKKK